MKRIAVALVSCSLLTLGACGGDEEGDGHKRPEALTEAAFVKQANAVCIATGKEFKKAYKRDRIRTAADQVGFLGGAGHDILERTYQGIDALVPPEELEDEVEAMLDAAEKSLAQLEQDPRQALSRGDLFAAANAKAASLGLKKCD